MPGRHKSNFKEGLAAVQNNSNDTGAKFEKKSTDENSITLRNSKQLRSRTVAK